VSRPKSDEGAPDGLHHAAGLPTVGLPALPGHRTRFSSPLAVPPLDDHVNAPDWSHGPRQALVEAPIPVVDDNEHLETRRRPGARRRQKLRKVSLAEAVRLVGIVQRLSLPEVGRRPFGPAPRADRSHGGSASLRQVEAAAPARPAGPAETRGHPVRNDDRGSGLSAHFLEFPDRAIDGDLGGGRELLGRLGE